VYGKSLYVLGAGGHKIRKCSVKKLKG